MHANANYRPIDTARIPATVRWDVPRRNQGQIVEVAYSDARPGRSEGGEGDLYRRIIDGSDGSVSYARRIGPRWVE